MNKFIMYILLTFTLQTYEYNCNIIATNQIAK